MAPVNQTGLQAPKQSQGKGEAADPASQPLTVSVSLETTADQLPAVLSGLGSFIPPNVSSLDVSIGVANAPPSRPE